MWGSKVLAILCLIYSCIECSTYRELAELAVINTGCVCYKSLHCSILYSLTLASASKASCCLMRACAPPALSPRYALDTMNAQPRSDSHEYTYTGIIIII